MDREWIAETRNTVSADTLDSIFRLLFLPSPSSFLSFVFPFSIHIVHSFVNMSEIFGFLEETLSAASIRETIRSSHLFVSRLCRMTTW